MSEERAKGLRRGLTSYGDPEFSLFLRKVFIKAAGYGEEALDRPVVGIADTRSDFNPCHGYAPQIVEALKRGILSAGGLPLVFPTMSIHESFAAPTSMYLRNLMAMETEEMIRAQPMDAVVLIGGCDKTVPAQLMAAASADVPAIIQIVGPMQVGHYRGEVLGACTDCRRLWAEHRAARLDAAEMERLSGRLAPGAGTCMVMGTASTMAALTEALGMTLPGSGSIPATAADRLRNAEAIGRRAAAMARGAGPRPSEIMTAAAFRNAMVTLQALGGSSNGLIHLMAIAGRLGVALDLAEFDRIGREAPVLVDVKPSGGHYLEHYHWAGGTPRLWRELRDLLDERAMTVTGEPLAAAIDDAEDIPGQTVIRPRAAPLSAEGAMAILFGNLCPRGALIKQAAASPALLRHEGRALVFEGVEDLARMDADDFDAAPGDILVLRNAGPRGAPGMPEAGCLPIPKRLLRQGVKDMVRISDARMSGTAFGTIVLHVTPEAAVGGPLALVRNGDRIRLDVPARRLDLLVEEAELAQRRAASARPAQPEPLRGYARLFQQAVLQADEGCDFDFLRKP